MPDTPRSSSDTASRRHFLKTTTVTVAALTGAATATTVTGAPAPSITIHDQDSDGDHVTIAEASTNEDARMGIRSEDTTHARYTDIEAGDTFENLEIELDEPITDSRMVRVSLHGEDGHSIAEDTAYINVGEEETRDRIATTLIEPAPGDDFNYPYYLYSPPTIPVDATPPVLVQPANSGRVADDLDTHKEAGHRTISSRSGREMSEELSVPFIVPVFPRPRRDPVDGSHYTHALDNTTMNLDDGPLERIDLQLLAMVDDARARLADHGIETPEEIMLNGFSASGNFVERFTALHPERVQSVTAGGLNGMPILPIEEAKGHTLNYHIGVANLEELTGEPFNFEAFRDTDKFLYMGELDRNDTIPYNDAWTGDFDQIALDVYGHSMHKERFPYSKAVYEDVGAQAVFRSYEDASHSPREAVQDVIAFHRASLRGTDFETLRDDFGGGVPNLNAYIEFSPQSPGVDTQVAFNASRSSIYDADIERYEWEFNAGSDDSTTATGEQVTHTFTRRGGHNIHLTVTDSNGDTYETVKQLVVTSEQSDGNNTTESTTDSSSNSDSTTDSGSDDRGGDAASDADADPAETSDDVPGFGVVTALGALGGAGYVLKRVAGKTQSGPASDSSSGQQ